MIAVRTRGDAARAMQGHGRSGEAMWNFYVRHSNGRWEVRPTQNGPTFSYDSAETALRVARASAERRWREQGIPCGVKVLDPDGNWVFESFHGPPPDTA
jgi:hypothetical protein